MARLLGVGTAILVVLAALPAASASGRSAVGGPAATVKTVSPTSRVVLIANRDTKAYNDFIIKATDSPKVTAASKPCAVASDTFTSGGKKHTDYRVECKKAVAPGKTLAVTLTTSGGGAITVYASVNGVFTQIST